jgi:Ca2+-binding EF-hand superfamily protein
MTVAAIKQKIKDFVLLASELQKNNSAFAELRSECQAFYASWSDTHSSAVVDQQSIVDAIFQCDVKLSGQRMNDILKSINSYHFKDGTIAQADVFDVVCKILESHEYYEHEVQCDLVDRDENDIFFISDVRCYRNVNGVGKDGGLGLYSDNQRVEERGAAQTNKTSSLNDSKSKIKLQLDELMELIQKMRVREDSEVIDVLVKGADGYFGKEEFVATLEAFGFNVSDDEIRSLHETIIQKTDVGEDTFAICCAYLKEKVVSSPLMRDSFKFSLVKADDMGMIYCISIQYFVSTLSEHCNFKHIDSTRQNGSISAHSFSGNSIFDEFDDLTMAIKTLIREANDDDVQFRADITNMITEMKALVFKASFIGGNNLIHDSSTKQKSSLKRHEDIQKPDKIRHRVSFMEDDNYGRETGKDLDESNSDTSSYVDEIPRTESIKRTDSEREWEHVMKSIEVRISEGLKNANDNGLQNEEIDEGDTVFSLENSFQRNKLLVALKTFRGNNGEEISKEEAGDACVHYFFDKHYSFYKKIFDRFSLANRFQCQKLEKFFDLVDMKKDGTVTKDDFIEWGRRVSHLSGITFTLEIQNAFLSVHDSYFGNGTGESVDQWVEFIGMMSNLPDAIEMGANTALNMFRAMDLNHDGDVQYSEFKAFVGALGVSSDDAELSFRIIDNDGNGKLSKKEVSEAFAHYLFDKEPSPAQNFFGPFFSLKSTTDIQNDRAKSLLDLYADEQTENDLQIEDRKAFDEEVTKEVESSINISPPLNNTPPTSSDKIIIREEDVDVESLLDLCADEQTENDLQIEDRKAFDEEVTKEVESSINISPPLNNTSPTSSDKNVEDEKQKSKEKLRMLEVKHLIDELKSKEEESSRFAQAAYLKEEKRLDAIKAAFDELFSDWKGIKSQNSSV